MTARSRRYSFPGRDHGVHPRFTAGDYGELVEAAARAGLTPTGYVGEAALAAARGLDADGCTDAGGITRAELAQLQRDLFAARTLSIQSCRVTCPRITIRYGSPQPASDRTVMPSDSD